MLSNSPPRETHRASHPHHRKEKMIRRHFSTSPRFRTLFQFGYGFLPKRTPPPLWFGCLLYFLLHASPPPLVRPIIAFVTLDHWKPQRCPLWNAQVRGHRQSPFAKLHAARVGDQYLADRRAQRNSQAFAAHVSDPFSWSYSSTWRCLLGMDATDLVEKRGGSTVEPVQALLPLVL